MGMRKPHSGCGTITPNPDPKNFKIIKLYTHGFDYTLVEVKYMGCTTHEGRKLLVYDKPSSCFNYKLKKLDPHFLGDEDSPIARFPADEKGMEHALLFLKMISKTQPDEIVLF